LNDIDFEEEEEEDEEEEEPEFQRRKRKQKRPSEFEKVLDKLEVKESRLMFRMVRERARLERLRLRERNRISYVT
jgi:hypothetical protein